MSSIIISFCKTFASFFSLATKMTMEHWRNQLLAQLKAKLINNENENLWFDATIG
jgi:hypothetical protein